jgi:uncharacterized protein with HEPN domain
MKKIDSDFIRLSDILNAISDIEEFSKNGFDDRQAMMAIAYAVAIIGEASNKLSLEITEKYSDIPWKQIVGMRHRIIHDYGNVDIENLEQVAVHDLPSLKPKIELILKNLPKIS